MAPRIEGSSPRSLTDMITIASMLYTKHAGDTRQGEQEYWRTLGPEYARKLFAGVKKYVPAPYHCVLFTDAPAELPSGIEQRPFPAEIDTAGWWRKLAIFQPGALTGKVLYLDLDNVIAGDLSALCALEPNPIMMLDDRVYPGMCNGSTILCYPEKLGFLYDWYAANQAAVRKQFSEWPHASDQAYIAHAMHTTYRDEPIPLMQNMLPPGYILNSRCELEQGADWSNTHLVYGSWEPKPHNSTHPFYRQHWTEN